MIELNVFGCDRPALVDDDFSFLARYRWRLHEKGFVYRHGDRVVKLARVIMHPVPPGYSVRHLNGSKLDCRRENLKLTDAKERSQNQSIRKTNRSGARGVYYDKSRGQFVASVGHDGRNFNLGRFDTFREAATVVERERPKIYQLSCEVETSALPDSPSSDGETGAATVIDVLALRCLAVPGIQQDLKGETVRHKEFAASDDPRAKRKRADRDALIAESVDRADSIKAQRAKEISDERISERVKGLEQDKVIDAMSLELDQQHARLSHKHETPPLDHRQQQSLKGNEI